MDASACACPVHQLLQTWRSPVRPHTARELVDIQRLAEAVKLLLQNKLCSLIREADHKPLLLSYTGDSTPVRTRVQGAFRSGRKRCRRSGYATKEYYVQNQFALFIDDVGCSKVAVLLCDPRPITNGKGMQAVFAFATDFLIDPRTRVPL